ncbi:acyltransferase family protein [Flavobacterium pedocola]
MSQNRNASLDFVKLLLAFLIIALHIFPIKGLSGWQALVSYEIANGITRIGVPSFFIISGYLLRKKLDDGLYLKRYCRRIVILYLVWQLIYLPDMIRSYRLGWFDTSELVYKLIYGYWHLWYLLATVIGVGLLYLSRRWAVKQKMVLGVSLFVLGYAFQLLYKDKSLDVFPVLKVVYEVMGTTRNGLFFAFPFLLLGTLYEHWKIKKETIAYLMPLFFIGLLLESYFYFTLKLGALDFYVFMLPVSMLVLLWAVESGINWNISIPSSLSLGIYLCHPYMIRLVYEFLPQRSFDYIVLKYFLICILGVLGWFLLKKINERFPYLL